MEPQRTERHGGLTAPAATAVLAAAVEPGLGVYAIGGVVTGLASSYSESPGWEGQATVALPMSIGGGIPSGQPTEVLVCADRCVTLPVVDSCPCYEGTPDQLVANLSRAAWRTVTDVPVEEGLIGVQVFLEPPQLGPDATPVD